MRFIPLSALQCLSRDLIRGAGPASDGSRGAWGAGQQRYSYLEKTLGNTASTRNTRLAAVKSFFKMAGLLQPRCQAQCRRIGRAICSGLEHAHEKKIIHRDLKPANILLGKEGSIKIADFGIARVCRDSMSRLTSQLDSGTLMYMSPEQLMGESSEENRGR